MAKIFYIHRDLRDVAVAAKYKWALEGDKLIEMLDRALGSYETMEEAKAFGMAWCLRQRYEDVFTNTEEAVREIAHFLGINPSSEAVDQVINDCSIEKMETITRSRFLAFNYRVRNHILGFMVKFIKGILPSSMSISFKRFRKYYLMLLPKVDQHTCMALRHIEPTKGVPGAWRLILTQEEQELIGTRYQNYFKRTGCLSVLRVLR